MAKRKTTQKKTTQKKVAKKKQLTINQQQTNNQLMERSIREMMTNDQTSRSQFIRSLIDPRRDINDECGYPETEEMTAEMYRDLYDREAIAARVVEVMPRESWQISPRVFETEDVENTTPFELALRELSKSLGGKGWFVGTQGDPLWSWLERVDVLSGIGTYGVLLLGLDDGLAMSEPAVGLNEKGENINAPEQKLLFIRAFDESLAVITATENDKENPRFGQPTTYQITVNNQDQDASSSHVFDTTTIDVHWTRVIHVADNRGSSQLFGVPRMLHVLNRLWDLRKLYSGSAEMYWRGAFPGLSIETHPQTSGEVLAGEAIVDLDEVRTAMEKYMSGLQRYMYLTGMTAKSLAPQVVDPTPQIDTQIEAICIEKAVPKRIFTGSERGELASSQDALAWDDRVNARRNNYLTPEVIVVVIDRFICLNVLPEPKEYNVIWPIDDTLSETDQATISVQRTEALSKYVMGGVEAMIVPVDFLVRVLGFTEEEATEIIDSAMSVEDDSKLTIEEEIVDEETEEEENETEKAT